MSNIEITGAEIEKTIIGDNNEVNIKRAGWFLSGFVVPILAALITEFIEQGKVSEILNLIIKGGLT